MGKIAELLTSWFGRSWLTTVVGFIGAIGIIVNPILIQGRCPTGGEWGAAALAAIFGMVSKSYNVTGPTKSDGGNTPS